MIRSRIWTGFITFTGMIMLVIVALKVMNWIPMAFRKDTLRPYDSIEQMRSVLNIRDVYVPSYFPQDIAWPPSKILAQDSPFPALVMEFRRTGTDDVILVLSQSQGGTLPVLHSLHVSTVREQVPFDLRGTQAHLTVGDCGKTDVCSSISWTEQSYTVTAVMRGVPSELSKIVVSMRPMQN